MTVRTDPDVQIVSRRAVLVSAASWAFVACQGDTGGMSLRDAARTGSSAEVAIERGEHEIRVLLDGSAFTALHLGNEWDKPFLYPLRTVSGTVVSRGYPVEPRDGEERDHDWHRGIWYGHGDINGHDFWRELGRDRTGTIVVLTEPAVETGEGTGSVAAELGLRSADGEIQGTLVQRHTFSAAGRLALIDTELEFRANQGRDLRFGDTEDGGFAMRLADEFRQERGAVLLNSDGLTDTERIWGQEARWVDYSATVAGRQAGVVILDHPSNLRHPTRWHARGYSLCSANPFGLSDFSGEAGADGSHTVPRGESLVLRYRVVIHEGPTTAAEIEDWFQEFAAD
ncbi:MAG: PmoA family protein [Bryobacterales bacterium]|nr:PmoA family protein [Bryobacterales bacterium]